MGKHTESSKKKFTEAKYPSHNNASWHTGTHGLLQHSPSSRILYYKGPTLQKISPALGGPSPSKMDVRTMMLTKQFSLRKEICIIQIVAAYQTQWGHTLIHSWASISVHIWNTSWGHSNLRTPNTILFHNNTDFYIADPGHGARFMGEAHRHRQQCGDGKGRGDGTSVTVSTVSKTRK